MHTMKHGRSSN